MQETYKKALLLLCAMNVTIIAMATSYKYFVAKDSISQESWWRGMAAASFIFGTAELLGTYGLFKCFFPNQGLSVDNRVSLAP